MADLAAQLVDCLRPKAPYRQYVFTFPLPLRVAMMRDNTVLSAVLQRSMRDTPLRWAIAPGSTRLRRRRLNGRARSKAP